MKSRLCFRGRRVSSRRLDCTVGKEGPRQDPYEWRELDVIQNGHIVTLRLGSLGYMRLSIDGDPIKKDAHFPNEQKALLERFKRLTGFDVDSFERAYQHLHRNDVEDPMGPASRYE